MSEQQNEQNEQNELVVFSCHPVQRLKIGRFQFEDGVLQLEGDDLKEFEDIIGSKSFPVFERNRIKKLSTSAVDAIVNRFRRDQATKQFDSGVGRDALQKLHQQTPTVGVKDIAKESQERQEAQAPSAEGTEAHSQQTPVKPAGGLNLNLNNRSN